ncbi:MAG: hypothetical protein ACFE0Q_21290 [Anaerolineae bacterium]
MSQLVIPQQSPLYAPLAQLAQQARVAIVVGLPGVGKSLYVQQLAVMAQRAERAVYLLQWDVTRSAFETPEHLTRYPEIDGVTHAMIRQAVGLWARGAVSQWSADHANDDALLIGEATFVGERLMQLARVLDDDAEATLTSRQTQFLLPVPNRRVRAEIEAKRAQTIANPQHAHERKDAPPNVLALLWHEIYQVAHQLNISDHAPADDPPYDPDIYRRTYEHLLQHRHSVILPVDELFAPTSSVYQLAGIRGHLQATPEQARAIMHRLEAQHSIEAVQASVANWYRG